MVAITLRPLVMVGVGGSTIRVKVAEPCTALLAVMVTGEVPTTVVVPEIKPLEVLTLNPAGNPLALKLVGLFVAVIWYVKGEPATTMADKLLLMTGAAA